MALESVLVMKYRQQHNSYGLNITKKKQLKKSGKSTVTFGANFKIHP